MSDRSEDAIVEAVRRGDRAAAEQLVRQLMPRTRNLVRYLLGHDGEVDDMTQHALLAILRGLSSFRGDAALTTWADRVTVRETLRRTQRRRQHDRKVRDAAAEMRGEDEVRRPSAEYIQRREALAMLEALPEEQRQVLVLHHVAGLSVPELAQELGVPFDTAKSRLRLGMKKLRELFGEGGA